jgi:hypothetical protein
MNESDLNNIESIVNHENKGENIIQNPEGELTVPISDNDFYRMTKSRMDDATRYWDKMKLSGIRSKNANYWLGKQLDDAALYDWQTPYMQNIIFRNVETIISNALGRLPSVVVIPASDTIQSKNNALLLQRKLRRENEDSRMRRKLRQALRHLIVLRLGALKIRWDDKLCGGKGDYIVEFVHPDDILVDATTYLGNNPSMVVHYLEEPIKKIIAKFPESKTQIFNKFDIKAGTEKQLDKVVRYPEIWFTYYDDNGDQIEAVGWRYEEVVFKVMKAPYFDYNGFQNEEGELAYRNYFDSPKKPFILLNYLSLGKTLIDDTTLVEQNLPLQDNVNKRGRQITQQADTANGKWVLSSDFIDKTEAEKITDDPMEHIIGRGKVSDGAVRIQGQGPSDTLFAAQQQDIGAMDDLFGTHEPTRGGVSKGNTATADVLAKEGDTTRIDDLVAEAVEIAVQDLTEWKTQLIKLFYTEEHYVKDLGKDGKVLMATLSQDMVEDGIEVFVKASSTDKDTIRSEAIELITAGMIDPLSLFEDLDKDDPKERAKRVMMYSQDPLRYQEEVLGMDTGDAGEVKKAIMMLKDGQIPNPPESVTEEYLAGMADYMESDEFKDLDPKIQAAVFEFVQGLQQKALQGSTEDKGQPVNATNGEEVNI